MIQAKDPAGTQQARAITILLEICQADKTCTQLLLALPFGQTGRGAVLGKWEVCIHPANIYFLAAS